MSALLFLCCYVWGAIVMGVACGFYRSGYPAWLCSLIVIAPSVAFVYGVSAG